MDCRFLFFCTLIHFMIIGCIQCFVLFFPIFFAVWIHLSHLSPKVCRFQVEVRGLSIPSLFTFVLLKYLTWPQVVYTYKDSPSAKCTMSRWIFNFPFFCFVKYYFSLYFFFFAGIKMANGVIGEMECDRTKWNECNIMMVKQHNDKHYV